VRPGLSPRGSGSHMTTGAPSADRRRPPIHARPSARSPPAAPSSAAQSRARERGRGDMEAGHRRRRRGPADPHRAQRGALFPRRPMPPPPPAAGPKASTSLAAAGRGSSRLHVQGPRPRPR
jgi:hypothetical protein